MNRAVELGNFGVGNRTIVRNINAGEKGAHFAASVNFFTVKCGEIEYKVVGKTQPADEFSRNMMHSDLQFHTEVLMYKEILPFLNIADLFPIMYFGQAEGNYEEDVILLEDMGANGYKVTKEKLYISIEHIRLAVAALAKIHAASITAKATKRKAFDDIKSRLKFKHFTTEDEDTSVEQCMARGVNPHMEKHDDILKPALKAMQDKGFFDLITKPKEPWAVICHGDFCRNNMLFKYEGDKPIAVKFFDLQTSRYTSPAIDLSFFLYLNMDKATRDVHWDSLLKLYLDSLKSHLSPNITIDEQGFYDDFASRAVYGYLHCSFFTPMMAVDTPPSVEEFGSLTLEQRTERMTSMGGEKGTQLISNIVEHLIKKGYIHKFLEYLKNNK